MGLWGYIKSGVSAVANAVGNAWKSAKGAVSTVANKVSSAISTAYSDGKGAIKDYANGVSGLANKVVDDTIGKGGVINNAVGSVTGILSTPLLLIAAGAAGFLIFSGRNSSVNATANYTG